jgi:hypothetical protein
MPHMPLTELEQQWMHDLSGWFCQPDEWCAAGSIGGNVTIFGYLRPPAEGEPMVIRFMRDETHGSGIYAVQQLAPNLYRCLLSGDLIEWDDNNVKVYSSLSRIRGGLRLDCSSHEASIDDNEVVDGA